MLVNLNVTKIIIIIIPMQHFYSNAAVSAITFVGFVRTRIAPSVLFLSPYAFASLLPIYRLETFKIHIREHLKQLIQVEWRLSQWCVNGTTNCGLMVNSLPKLMIFEINSNFGILCSELTFILFISHTKSFFYK